MKFGMRKPSMKRSISARTTGRLKRSVKKAVIPGYGKRGMGWLHLKKAFTQQGLSQNDFQHLRFSQSWEQPRNIQ